MEAVETRHSVQTQLNAKLAEIESLKSSDAEMRFELENLRSEQQRQLENLKKEQIVLEHQLEKEKSNSENEKSKRIQQERDNQGMHSKIFSIFYFLRFIPPGFRPLFHFFLNLFHPF